MLTTCAETRVDIEMRMAKHFMTGCRERVKDVSKVRWETFEKGVEC
jgi:hypothetical protein